MNSNWEGELIEQQMLSLGEDAQRAGTGRKPLGGQCNDLGENWWGPF